MRIVVLFGVVSLSDGCAPRTLAESAGVAFARAILTGTACQEEARKDQKPWPITKVCACRRRRESVRRADASSPPQP
jgi:hypothetical protein